MLKKTLLSALAMALGVALIANVVMADTSGKRIALSNNYAGNSWRQAMLKSWDKVTSAAVEKGVVAEAPAFTTAENQVTEQAAQIQNLILQGFDAIVVNGLRCGHRGRVLRRHRHRALRLPHCGGLQGHGRRPA